MRKQKHNTTAFNKQYYTSQPEHIRKLEDVTAEQAIHAPICAKIAEYFNKNFGLGEVTVEHHRTMKYKHVLFNILNKEFKTIGEYTMYYGTYKDATSGHDYYIVRKGFSIYPQYLKK